ncbi:glutamate-cysteine ligase [Moraxella macacae 0408225]|uniref:Glutamate--cysteine ligase n=1 Tax=Moraxella macacae 0408225 TaxID=1230338 RepID=L2F9F3_9GAMM|nr:glutamate--cysteine ligase [Moraxella macacae]ELA09083.1 glutamate-cysteine ligase [Moraxella macacae 0408225]
MTISAFHAPPPQWLTSEHLTGMLRGIEKEGLRMNPQGYIASSPHPHALGSKLTHPFITTDYAESLLELITQPQDSPKKALSMLRDLHIVVQQSLQNDELFWPLSMPCMLSDNDDEIVLADYGTSNIGKLKTLYRHGLGIRYGRRMQTIAGLHYNLSFGDELFKQWQVAQKNQQSLTEFKNDKYLALIRNFKRLSGLVLYLFGASPSVCKCFLTRRKHHLQALNDSTYYLPNATSLRMGKLGYQNSVQDDLDIRYNNLFEYIQGLRQAIHTPNASFKALGVDNKNGTPIQINDHVLQIENEYYSPIRPKQVTKSGENPSDALANRGIAYIEFRAIDLDPYSDIGIRLSTACFMEILALYCLINESPELLPAEEQLISQNQEKIVNQGRDVALTIQTNTGKMQFGDWISSHLTAMLPLARLLDGVYGNNDYRNALTLMLGKAQNPNFTLSAQVLHDTEHYGSAWKFGKALAKQHAKLLRSQSLGCEKTDYYQQLAKKSQHQQTELEQQDTLSFYEFVQQYR